MVARSRMTTQNESSRPRDFHVAVDPTARRSLRRQVADSIRDSCRGGRLSAGMTLPSTRELAAQLRVSRGVVTDAYNQLAAEGYIEQRPRHAPIVRDTQAVRPNAPEPRRPTMVETSGGKWRHNLAAWAPDPSVFPRASWTRALRRALQAIPDRDLGYVDPRGSVHFRESVCDYLARTRGCATDPVCLVSCGGFSHGLYVSCVALRRHGVTSIAVEDPSRPEFLATIRIAGLDPVPIPVDDQGIRIDILAASAAQAVVVTPAHQFPTGVVLSAPRRQALLDWAAERRAFIIENDYDAEYRYDREPVGALQGRMESRIIFIGTTSKTMAPALRIGWLHVPRELLDIVIEVAWDTGWSAPSITFWAFADLLERGEIDRHLRRTRSVYRARRGRLIEEIARALPDVTIGGIAAGLHLTLAPPTGIDSGAVAHALRRRGVLVETLAESAIEPRNALPGLVVGYSRITETEAPVVVQLLVEAVAEQRTIGLSPAKH